MSLLSVLSSIRSVRRACLPLLLSPTALLLSAGVSQAQAVLTVDVNTDSAATITHPGDGLGDPGDLRSTILNSNSGDTIQFACGSPCIITLNGPLPPITHNLTIDGGSLGNVIIDGQSLYRVFFVDTGTVQIENLLIRNARAKGGDGGSGSTGCGGGGAGLGAGLFVNGVTAPATVTLTDVFFLDDSAVGGDGCTGAGGSGSGGGGGLGGNGGNGEYATAYTNGGGGGVLGPGANGDTSDQSGAAGGAGGGGGSAPNDVATVVPGTGGSAYGTNAGGGNSQGQNGGSGGVGGGGGGSTQNGGAGGFGGGGGGGFANGGNGGPGGGGGGSTSPGSGGALVGAVGGGDASFGGGGSGGGAAAGPDIFVNQGTLITQNSSSMGASASGGIGQGGAGNGGADATPVFNYLGIVNGASTKGPIAAALTVSDVPTLVVTSTEDSGAGSLREALASADSVGAGNITFDPTVFDTPQTITLESTLNIPSDTTITGATTGSGATLQNLVTVSGGGPGSDFSIFTVGSAVTATINNLIIANGNNNTYLNANGGGISNAGSLTVTGSTFENNFAGGVPSGSNGGGAIYSTNNLTVRNSTFAANTSAPGGAINASDGTVTIDRSTFLGNSALGTTTGGAVFINSNATVTITESTISGNLSAGGGGAIFNNATLTATNTIMAGNRGGDCGSGGASNCPQNGTNGNVIGVANIGLAPLGNYGGPTLTMIPLPGSPAICAGSQAQIPSGVATDQRGYPNTNAIYPGYSAGAACVDTGAVQTNYALSFTQQPPANVDSGVSMSPAPAVALTESGNPFTSSGVTIPLTLSPAGTFSGGSATTSAGVATYSGLTVGTTTGSDDTLTAILSLNPNLSTPLSLAVTSNSFNVASAVTATQAIASEVLTFNQPSVSFTPVAGTGGTAPLSYSISPALPGGLSFTSSTGAISGTPTAVSAAATYTVTVTDTNGGTATASFSLAVNPVTPTLHWAAPANIAYDTPLSANQLDATASVPGAFVYNPPAGTVLAPGMHTLTATFTPTDTTDYKTPPPVTVSLDVTSATLTVTANNATRVYGAANPAFTGTVSGAVNGDAFTESFFTTATVTSNVGTYPIVPSVTGTNLADYSVQTTNGALTIAQATSATTLSASASSITAGQSLTLTATVTDTAPNSTGTPTGTVSFFDGSTLLSTSPLSGGTASYATATLAPGVTHTLTASYSGDGNFTASSAGPALSIPVGTLDFTLTTSATENQNQTQTVLAGGAATYSFNIAPENGAYPGPVTFSVTGLPPGAVAVFSPASVPANGGAQAVVMTVQTPGPTAKTSHPFEREVPLAFAVLLLPLMGRRRARAGLLGLMIAGALLAGAISISGCGSQNGFNGQAVKNYSLIVTATSGQIVHTFDVNLNLQ